VDAVLHYLPGKDGAGPAVRTGGGGILWRRFLDGGPPSFLARRRGRFKQRQRLAVGRPPLQSQNHRLRAVLRLTSLCVELRSIPPFSRGVAFALPLSQANDIVLLRTAIDALTAVLLPAPCRICGTTLLNAIRIPICESCLGSFQPLEQPTCECCGRPFPVAVAAAGVKGGAEAGATAGEETARHLCRLCHDGYYAFDRARSYGIYNDALHHAILLLKYEEVTRLGVWFSARLGEIMAREGDAFRADVIVPMPLHPDRQRERGFN
jgi:hypothetical protein